MVGQQVSIKSRFQTALAEALAYTAVVGDFRIKDYSIALDSLSELHNDQRALRDSLFVAANLPAEPEKTWEDFIRSGQEYRRHLESHGVHDDTRCLYCRQLLDADALELLSKYREYLESQIAKDIEAQELTIQTSIKQLLNASLATVEAFCQPADSDTDEGFPAPGEEEQIKALRGLIGLDGILRQKLTEKAPVNEDILSEVSAIGSHV